MRRLFFWTISLIHSTTLWAQDVQNLAILKTHENEISDQQKAATDEVLLIGNE